MSKFFTFYQNNSGREFDVNDKVNIYVIIEANNTAHANERAQEIGLYFDGVQEGVDCECCGDRWSEVYSEGTEQPQIYGETNLQPYAGKFVIHKL